MNNNILCGSSCVKYILNYYKINTNNLNCKMTWITQLAICLKKYGLKNIHILCYKSNLYFDFLKSKKIDLKFDGFKYIDRCFKQDIKIIEKKLNVTQLLKEIRENEFIILCVESAVFNKENITGGHYIIISGLENKKVKIINPIKSKYEYKFETPANIIKYCKNYGSWRILIKEEKSD